MEKIQELKSNSLEFTHMVLDMRLLMNQLNQTTEITTLSSAKLEAESNFANNRKVFVYVLNDELIGYSVLKIEEQVCWLDWLFVKSSFFGKGIASDLFDHAEKYALELGNDQLYIWVHPDNHRMLRFLKKKGYDVLNLLEIKKSKTGANQIIRIFENEFKY